MYIETTKEFLVAAAARGLLVMGAVGAENGDIAETQANSLKAAIETIARGGEADIVGRHRVYAIDRDVGLVGVLCVSNNTAYLAVLAEDPSCLAVELAHLIDFSLTRVIEDFKEVFAKMFDKKE